jgi:epoxyqueuosine reductase
MLRLKEEAERLGFVACAVADADPIPETRLQFEDRLDRGFLSGLPWMHRARAERATNPELLLAGARSIISVAASYGHQSGTPPEDGVLRGRVARYAWGRDYHRVLEKKLKRLCEYIAEEEPGARSRILVDYGPLAERAYAARAGLGWFGKSTNLLLPGIGSWVLLGEIVTTAAFDQDLPVRKACGSCRRCADGCPTGAIVDGYLLNNELCISYQTIENRGPIPRELRPLVGDWLFGCDICQEVCPVGRRSEAPVLDGLAPAHPNDRYPDLIALLSLDEDAFRERFAGRAIMRAKRDGLLRNACVVLGNSGDERAVPALERALADKSALVRGHAAWALGRIATSAATMALRDGLSHEVDAWVREELELALTPSR